jgi:hypothetical protein
MPNKYCFAISRTEKLRILAKNIRYKYAENGTPLTLENFAEYSELLRNTCGIDTTYAIYESLCNKNA